jgi:hypothetical protein
VQSHTRRLARNLRLDFHHGYVVQPDVHNLSVWRVGKDVQGVVRWLDQAGIRDWAIAEVRRRLRPRTTP